MKKITLAFVTVCTIFTGTAIAHSAPQTHDGFFMSFALGLSHQGFNYNYSKIDAELESSGDAANYQIKLGGRIADNLLLHFTLIDEVSQSIIEPTYNEELYSEEFPETYGDNNINLLIMGFGSTYYFPLNIFLTASLGISTFELQGKHSDPSTILSSSKLGFAFQISAGREWWVSENWALGLSLNFIHSSAKDKGNSGDMSSNSISISLTATYN